MNSIGSPDKISQPITAVLASNATLKSPEKHIPVPARNITTILIKHALDLTLSHPKELITELKHMFQGLAPTEQIVCFGRPDSIVRAYMKNPRYIVDTQRSLSPEHATSFLSLMENGIIYGVDNPKKPLYRFWQVGNFDNQQYFALIVPYETVADKELAQPSTGLSYPPNTAVPPQTIVNAIGTRSDIKRHGQVVEHMEWRAVPALHTPQKRLSEKELLENGQVDAYQRLESLLGRKELDGTLRTMDAMNGCGRQCDTCYAAAMVPTKYFTYESLNRLFSDKRFQKMLMPDSLRFGSVGDIMEHPQGLNIIEMALEKTESLDKDLMAKAGKHHRIKIYTNFRKKDEQKLSQLLQLARKYPDRLKITISLPFNAVDTVQDQFIEYAKKNPDSFKLPESPRRKDGMGQWESVIPNVGVANMYDALNGVILEGRHMPKEIYEKRHEEFHFGVYDPGTEDNYFHTGYVKTYFNPDGLWLRVYGTKQHSYTSSAFVPITPTNLGLLSMTPYHPDFRKYVTSAPNWSSLRIFEDDNGDETFEMN